MWWSWLIVFKNGHPDKGSHSRSPRPSCFKETLVCAPLRGAQCTSKAHDKTLLASGIRWYFQKIMKEDTDLRAGEGDEGGRSTTRYSVMMLTRKCLAGRQCWRWGWSKAQSLRLLSRVDNTTVRALGRRWSLRRGPSQAGTTTRVLCTPPLGVLVHKKSHNPWDEGILEAGCSDPPA